MERFADAPIEITNIKQRLYREKLMLLDRGESWDPSIKRRRALESSFAKIPNPSMVRSEILGTGVEIDELWKKAGIAEEILLTRGILSVESGLIDDPLMPTILVTGLFMDLQRKEE